MATKNKVLAVTAVLLMMTAATIWYFAFQSAKLSPVGTGNDNRAAAESGRPAAQGSRYASLKGDAFDKAYIADMMMNREGMLNLSEQAVALVTRDELRTLAVDLLQSQGSVVMQLMALQEKWGYETATDGSNPHLNHGVGGVERFTGEAYDEEFLKQMIVYHEQAIEMSQFASANAKNQETKELARTIIGAETAGIEQIKQWQKEWGY